MVEKPPARQQIDISSLAEAGKFGEHLGRLLIPGDVLLLSGDLGAGKTTLTQSIARGLEVPEDYYITSPSFVLMHEYPGRCPLYHIDCYRLGGEDDIEGAGLLDYLETRIGVCVVEWPERLGSLTPKNFLEIHIRAVQGEQRKLTLVGQGSDWEQRVDGIIDGRCAKI
jgi:tRNA threonylcarbamoyladenosine biosynthesis protein TsaE